MDQAVKYHNVRRLILAVGVFAGVILLGTGNASAIATGKVLASGDEWVLSDAAYSGNNGSTTAFANNIVGYVGGTRYLIAANDWQNIAYGSGFQSQLASLGVTTTDNPSFTFSLASLAQFDAVFLAGTNGSGTANASLLNQYVQSSGSVFVCLGTGEMGGAPGEAAAWNPFLETWGLTAGSAEYFGAGNVPLVPSGHPLQVNVAAITWSAGQEISVLDPNATVFTGQFGGAIGNRGILGVANVPEPSTLALLVAGAISLLFCARRWRMRAA